MLLPDIFSRQVLISLRFFYYLTGSFYKPVSTSARIVFVSYWLACIIITATYTGNMVAFLSVSRPVLPFMTLEEMTQQSVYKYGTLGGTFIQEYLQVRQPYI